MDVISFLIGALTGAFVVVILVCVAVQAFIEGLMDNDRLRS